VPEALSEVLEVRTVDFLSELAYAEVRMHGVAAKRKVIHFGWVYGYESWQLTPGPPIPPGLLEVRDRVADVIGIEPPAFEQVLVTEYPPGSGIGWHRDAPMFGPVVMGVSLGGACLLRLRPQSSGRTQFEIRLEPRSVYVLAGAARAVWQHSIPPTSERRYSVTFRTIAAGWRRKLVATNTVADAEFKEVS
jgi:alkylated DNA repair protein (DNA oxidative demethylase)